MAIRLFRLMFQLSDVVLTFQYRVLYFCSWFISHEHPELLDNGSLILEYEAHDVKLVLYVFDLFQQTYFVFHIEEIFCVVMSAGVVRRHLSVVWPSCICMLLMLLDSLAEVSETSRFIVYLRT